MYLKGRDAPEWYVHNGRYVDSVFQRIMPHDAIAFAAALDVAAARIEAGDRLDELVQRDGRFLKPKEAGSLPAQPLRALVGYSDRLRTLAVFLREATATGQPILLPPPDGTMLLGAVATAKGSQLPA